ncbi:serine hydrolase [Actinocorallia aurantiaca]|uniref:Beta-lactamase class A catalytic domain-containing protein n=1 Tax=Actinocorallia aurantiaca TaxID=46204 RepID=A0ABN3TVK9_9ACTN
MPVYRAISRKAVAGTVAGALVTGLLVAAPGRVTAARPLNWLNCSSDHSPELAQRLENRLRKAVRGRSGTMSFALYDRERKVGCYYGSGRHYDSASTVKLTIVAALLRTAQKQKRGLTAREKSLARAAITRSDNDATTVLWRQLGRSRVQGLLNAVGMRATRLDPGGHWGLTRTTAVDQLRLLLTLTRKGDVLNAKSRRHLLKLMSEVVSGQRWGTPAGASSKIDVRVKNGWLPRAVHGWRVHSLGIFGDDRRDYMIAVLTQDNPSLKQGIIAIERVSRIVHGTLVPESSARRIPTPYPPEIGDGSAPFTME